MAFSAVPSPRPIDRHATIAILTHADHGLIAGTTLARIATEHWAPAGHRVVAHRGLGTPPPADLAFLHVGFTVIPELYRALAARYPRTINGGLVDTLKRRVCTDLLRPDDPYDGPVIVKTDLNHGGKPEWRQRVRQAELSGKLWLKLQECLPARWFGRLEGNLYPVLPHKRDVPDWVWRSPDLVVQPLHAERRGELYAMHQWYFLGDRDCVSTFLGRAPVVKLANVVERLPLHADVPEAMRRRRVELNFDYGKFDYVVVDGEAILLDANPTPNEGNEFPTPPRVVAICGAIAAGLGSFLG